MSRDGRINSLKIVVYHNSKKDMLTIEASNWDVYQKCICAIYAQGGHKDDQGVSDCDHFYFDSLFNFQICKEVISEILNSDKKKAS